MEQVTSDTPVKRGPLWAVVLFLVAGLYAACYLIYAKLMVEFQAPGFASECNINSALNCDALLDKPESSLFGLPLSLFAIPTYCVMMLLALRGLRGGGAGRAAISYLATIGTLTVIHSGWMGYVSAGYGVFCPYCALMYAVNAAVTVSAFWAAAVSPLTTLKACLLNVGQLASPMLMSAALLLLTGGASLWGYGEVHDRVGFDATYDRCENQDMFACAELSAMYADGRGVVVHPEGASLAAKKACELGHQEMCVTSARSACDGGDGAACLKAAQMYQRGYLKMADGAAELVKDPTQALAALKRGCDLGNQDACGEAKSFGAAISGETTRTTTGKGKTAGAANRSAPTKKVKPKLTDNGWDYYEIPVGPNDHTLGPADAPVTYVVFKDFECGFCRFVSSQEKPLKEKYKDQVRFVFKHYPMNADCNARMGTSRMHEGACRASAAAICAEEQGRFWEMHDVLYKNQKKFSDEQLESYASEIGLNIADYKACYASDRPAAKMAEDVRLAAKMRIMGTPRIYINNRLVTGSTAKDVLDYYIQMAMTDPGGGGAAEAKEASEDSPRMVKMTKTSGEFYIDAFEASISKGGKAHSVPKVQPALASWYDAKASCEKAGKRLCSEEEWVSACIGQAAVDDNKNGFFTDGKVQGRLYPYGAFYQAGACRDSEDKYSGEAGMTGANSGCRTAEGIYDMSGNLYEWIGTTEDKAAMIGGDWRSKTAATCRRRTKTYGPGIKNNTTGFRCCSDEAISDAKTVASMTSTEIPDIVGATIPNDLVLETMDGGKLTPGSFKGKVTYLTFFASWCGNCRKQMPAVKEWETEWGSKGFQVVAINVDRQKAAGERYINTVEPNFKVAFDPNARTMSDFDINAMPSSFLVNRKGVITKRIIGYKADEIAATKTAIEALF